MKHPAAVPTPTYVPGKVRAALPACATDGRVVFRRAPSMPSGNRVALRDLLAAFEKSLILAALLAAGGNQKRAAIALGILPTTLAEKLKRFGLSGQRPSRASRAGERVVPPVASFGLHIEAPTTPLERQQRC